MYVRFEQLLKCPAAVNIGGCEQRRKGNPIAISDRVAGDMRSARVSSAPAAPILAARARASRCKARAVLPVARSLKVIGEASKQLPQEFCARNP